MKVPAEMHTNIVSTNKLVSASIIPITTPIGVRIEKRLMKAVISFNENPVLAKAPPRETAAAGLWNTIPKPSCQA